LDRWTLDCLTVGLLDCWTVGLLDRWTFGLLDCCTIEYFFEKISKINLRAHKALDYWTVGLLNILFEFLSKNKS
jgi:hypothetical protein